MVSRCLIVGQFFGYGKDVNGKEELIFSAVFKPFAKMDEQEKEVKFCGKYFTRLLHEGPYIEGNEAHSGQMIAFGWRQGTDTGHRGGAYARAEGGQKKLEEYQEAHSHIADGTSVPASNLTVTTLDFHNGIYKDKDATAYTFGQWFPTYNDGQLVENPEEACTMTSGGYFVLPDYGIAINFGSCADIFSVTWCGPIDYHNTTMSVTNPGYYCWGTPIQCAKRLQNAVRLQCWVILGEKIKMRGKSKQGKPRFVQVFKIKDFYAHSSLPRPEHPNPRWYEGLWEGDNGYVEQEVSAVDAEDEEVEGEDDEEGGDSDEYQDESDAGGEDDED
ncbi:hypothetical protein FRC09_009878 [Ceratobasidium sp. 395]|nr:hypothetical protein FRC09_009878 [Ceratobasidium sp. 395]